MSRSKQFLREQIARAQRFAQAMNTEADREKFERMAASIFTAAAMAQKSVDSLATKSLPG